MRSASRLVIIALLGLFVALPLTALAASASTGAPPSADDEVVVVQPTTTSPSVTAPPGGPGKLEPDTEADQAESRRKLVMGVSSVVLIGLVIWGRSIRRKKRKKQEGAG